ncbi:hypothetical protein C4565_00595 [Candidatus Parcubacteria bacterium]|nr:MAG: hypothetical protein C4565_00595 [Candidatus Parcubacteria bacterium]
MNILKAIWFMFELMCENPDMFWALWKDPEARDGLCYILTFLLMVEFVGFVFICVLIGSIIKLFQ